MTEVAALIADLIRAGVDPELVGRTAAALSEREPVLVLDEAAERRRLKDKERKRLRKSAESAEVQEQPSLPSKENPQTPKETQPTLPTTQQEKTPKGVQKKASRLPPDWVLPEGWGRDAVEAGLPAHLIDLEASKMRDWSLSAAKGACTDWRARWRNWCREAAARMPQARGSPPRALDNLIDSLAIRMDDADANSPADFEGYQAAPRLISAR